MERNRAQLFKTDTRERGDEMIMFLSPTMGPLFAYAVMAKWGLEPGQVIGYPLLGLRGLDSNYAAAESQLDAQAETGQKIQLAGWSQGALHALPYALRHPHVVERLALIAGPFGGSLAASPLAFIPAIRGMRTGSGACRRLRDELFAGADSLPETHVFIPAQDRLLALHEAVLPGFPLDCDRVKYHVFGSSLPRNLPFALKVGFIQVAGVNHLNVGLHPAVVPHIMAALTADPMPVHGTDLMSAPLTA
jgi:pimeloyl-ACP methyl ester carboxylesterase